LFTVSFLPCCGQWRLPSKGRFTLLDTADLKQENREGRIELRDEDADTVKRFLSYMYLQDYDQANGSLTLNKTREAGVVGNPDTDSIQDANTAQPSMVAEDASATEVKEIAHNNLRVYIAADKFGTYPLKKLAKDRLVSWAEKNWRDDGFPDAVREIISSVPPQETELCEDLSNVISKNVQSLVERESVLEVLEEFGVLSTAVLEKLVGRLKFSEEERERLITLCRENSFGRTLMTKVNSLSNCRHCHAEFNLRVDCTTIGWGSIRCGRCRTRH
jgi:hypothetical protein